MSDRCEIASNNRGLFNRDILVHFLQDIHYSMAENIRQHFQNAKSKNPYKLTNKQLRDLSEDDTIDYYIDPILDILGFKSRKKRKDSSNKFPDLWLFSDEPEQTYSPENYQRSNLTILEAKKYSVDLDKGDGRNEKPPDQICGHVNTNVAYNPLKRWGILSNGYKWRLYSSEGQDKFIEFDLDVAIHDSLEELAIFCLIFSPGSFSISLKQKVLLDQLRVESLASWTKITSQIEDRGPVALLHLIRGFHDAGENLEPAKEKAYNLLYKILYILYVESSRLLPFFVTKSLRSLINNIHIATLKEYDISRELSSILSMYHKGTKELPARFGGELFEAGTSINIKNKFLSKALDTLTVLEREKINYKFFDYSSLNVELIGNIYEGTLNLQFEVKGKIVDFKKTKKKTGSAAHSTGTTYTPSNVVRFLVNESLPDTLKKIPLICDPACGSGHFLVQALRAVSSRLDLEVTKSLTFQDHKRTIALRGIFGIDINSLA
jgi:hypothetical protein